MEVLETPVLLDHLVHLVTVAALVVKVRSEHLVLLVQ